MAKQCDPENAGLGAWDSIQCCLKERKSIVKRGCKLLGSAMLKVFPLVNFQFPTCLHLEAFLSFGILFGTGAPRNRLRPTRMLVSSVLDSCRRLPSGEWCHMLRIYFSFTFSPGASDVSALLCGEAQLFPHVLDHNSSQTIFQTWGRSSFWATICPKVGR